MSPILSLLLTSYSPSLASLCSPAEPLTCIGEIFNVLNILNFLDWIELNDLKLKLVSHCLKWFLTSSSQFWEFYVDTAGKGKSISQHFHFVLPCSYGGSQISWTECQHAKTHIRGKGNFWFNFFYPFLKATKHFPYMTWVIKSWRTK